MSSTKQKKPINAVPKDTTEKTLPKLYKILQEERSDSESKPEQEFKDL